MEADKLGQILREADRLAGAAPPLSPDLAGRVRQLARLRRRVLIRNGALAAGLAILLTALLAARLSAKRGTATMAHRDDSSAIGQLVALQAEVHRLREELEDLKAEAALSSRPVHTTAMPAAAPDADDFDQQLERAAYLIVYQADRYRRELNMPDSAVVSYRQAIELFPRTRAAQTARVRLAQLENAKGKPL